MIAKKSFYFISNEPGVWFIDLPDYIESGGSVDDLYMIAGADEFLDYLAKGNDIVGMRLSDKEFPDAERLHWIELGKVEGFENGTGAWYHLLSYNNESVYFKMWLCDVTRFVFDGCFPSIIYFKVIE